MSFIALIRFPSGALGAIQSDIVDNMITEWDTETEAKLSLSDHPLMKAGWVHIVEVSAD